MLQAVHRADSLQVSLEDSRVIWRIRVRGRRTSFESSSGLESDMIGRRTLGRGDQRAPRIEENERMSEVDGK